MIINKETAAVLPCPATNANQWELKDTSRGQLKVREPANTLEKTYRQTKNSAKALTKACKSAVACRPHSPEETYKESRPPWDQYSVL